MLLFVGPLFEQRGECHNLVFRQRDGDVIHVVLETKGDADWAWRGGRTLGGRQAESEGRGKSEKGTKVVVGESPLPWIHFLSLIHI